MKVAIIGSRNLTVTEEELEFFLPKDTTKIISGGAKGIDTCAREYALSHGIRLTEILPDYARFRRGAPLKRNDTIIACADEIIAFWDGKSKGTAYVIAQAKKQNKKCTVYYMV